MTFPDAFKGIKKVFTAQILTLIGTACVILGSIVAAIAAVSALSSSSSGDIIAYGAGAGVLAAAGLVIPIVAYIINLVGLHQAGKDDESLRNAFIVSIFVLIIEIVSAILNAIFSNANSVTGNVAEVIASICQIIVMVLVITGICNLADKLKRDDVDSSGRNILIMVIVMYGLSIVSKIILLISGNGSAGSVLYIVLTLASGIFSIITYIFYLVFLGKAKNMLRDN